jgi:hypothetical protein
MNSRRFTDARWLHRLFLRFRLVATDPDNFGNRAVGRAEFQRTLARFGNDRTPVGLDFCARQVLFAGPFTVAWPRGLAPARRISANS